MRLLMISALAGHGHVRAAQALERTAREVFPQAEVRNVDILDYTQAIYRKAYAASYLKLADRAPELWGYLYNKGDRPVAGKRQAAIIRAFDRIEFAKFRAMLREYQPDHMFCTHFLPAQILLPYSDADWNTFKLNLVVTDFMAHGFWAQVNAHTIFCASGESMEELAIKGIDRARIRKVGIPIMPEFAQRYDRAEMLRKHGLQEGTPVVLAMSGGWGAAGMPNLTRMILDSGRVQVIAVCGRNEKMQAEVAKIEAPAGSRVIALGYVNYIHELMAVSDLCVTKAGGLTTSECLAMGVPMIVPNPIPGQEERNAEYLTEAGACMMARSPGSLKYKLTKFLNDHALRTRMRAAARAKGVPDAAAQILRIGVTPGA
ncbi:MAG: glycosyltransferase [Planctomycetes bacterium]|nr:glycosyltransferase [Planctomycetota bacterium]MCW8136428.1 glycosyltransferase [Planctomycetota bacterium]